MIVWNATDIIGGIIGALMILVIIICYIIWCIKDKLHNKHKKGGKNNERSDS